MVSVLGGNTPLGREVKEQIDSANLGVIVRTFTVGRGAAVADGGGYSFPRFRFYVPAL